MESDCRRHCGGRANGGIDCPSREGPGVPAQARAVSGIGGRDRRVYCAGDGLGDRKIDRIWGACRGRSPGCNE